MSSKSELMNVRGLPFAMWWNSGTPLTLQAILKAALT